MTSASDEGMSAAAPAACTMRHRISTSAVGATPHAIDAAVKAVEPTRNTRRWPTRSATFPAGMRSAANTIVYALSTHESSDGVLVAKSREMAGKATYRIVVSRKVASVASDAMTSVRLAWVGTEGQPVAV